MMKICAVWRPMKFTFITASCGTTDRHAEKCRTVYILEWYFTDFSRIPYIMAEIEEV